MYEFGPKDCYEFFEENGVPLKIEGNRVFPKSENGEDIVDMFIKILKQNNVKIMNKKIVQDIKKSNGIYKIILNNGLILQSDRIILTTGGRAYSKTGSKGDGYKFAKSLGHTITKTVPTLTSFLSNDIVIKKLAGVSFSDVKIKLIVQKSYEFSGAFIFTHKGVSGPAIFALSAFSAYEDLSRGAKLNIDFVPKSSRENIKAEFRKSMNKKIIQEVSKYVTRSLADVIVADRTKNVNEIGKKEMHKIVESLKNFEINIIGRTPGREIVTAGGINLEEVDKKTMQSQINPGLYFAGEILDVDGLTGGYNLQNAWATGKLAGESATKVI